MNTFVVVTTDRAEHRVEAVAFKLEAGEIILYGHDKSPVAAFAAGQWMCVRKAAPK